MRSAEHFAEGGLLSRAVPRYERREAQVRMASAVEEILADGGTLLVEAGTGTGKTLAYLLPALLSGQKVIVSTGTRNLQDQIMEHDLPLLRERLGLRFRATSVKGLSNYLCLRRFEELRSSGEAAAGDLADKVALLERFRQETESGDRSDLPLLSEDDPVWGQVVSSTETRIGPRCRFHDECFVTAVRRRAEEADLVVVNHHLYFADLSMRRGRAVGVLPDHDAVIFDEAHQIEDVATLFYGVSVSTARLQKLAQDAERAVRGAFRDLAEEPRARRLTETMLAKGAALFEALPDPGEGSRLPVGSEEMSSEAIDRLHDLDTALEALESHCRLRAGEGGEALAQIARRTGQLRDELATAAAGGHGRRVSWIARRGRTLTFGSSPVDVSGILREELFHRMPAVVLTSATLTTGGDFGFVERRLGIDFEVREERLPSPFDYASRVALYLPEHLPDPRSPAFAARAEEEIARLVELTDGGAFILCTSFRMMHRLARALSPKMGHRAVLVQGDAPKASLLERFRGDGRAVLFATASFWEGVDVPGRALRLVVIDKLPFEVPTDPLVRARCEALESAGESAFMGYLVPSAALSLKQGFGRLIRTRTDQGVVAILDPRIVRKGYGRVFLRSLPDARRVRTFEEVQAFLRTLCPDESP